jgi:hypothetical protein
MVYAAWMHDRFSSACTTPRSRVKSPHNIASYRSLRIGKRQPCGSCENTAQCCIVSSMSCPNQANCICLIVTPFTAITSTNGVAWLYSMSVRAMCGRYIRQSQGQTPHQGCESIYANTRTRKNAHLTALRVQVGLFVCFWCFTGHSYN